MAECENGWSEDIWAIDWKSTDRQQIGPEDHAGTNRIARFITAVSSHIRDQRPLGIGVEVERLPHEPTHHDHQD